ncbi:DUF3667 domain-containing protein [Hymenobacter algoricola]|uniref:DUF3667 domain-containing protein n=1 Tax=Hymenobacter algoricola TaxID=486267 RepID=A0ABP7MJ68_9BACT
METLELPLPATASASPTPHACLNCGTALHDQFCARCGQPAATHRITTAHLLHEIPHSIWHVDKGILFTLRELVLRPGAALRAYLGGQRRPYFAPLSYLLLAVGVATFLMAALHIVPFDLHDPRVSARTRELQLHAFGPVLRYMSWYQVVALPLLALPTRLVLRRGGFNYAECIVINAFVIGTASIINMAFIPLMYVLSGTAGIVRLTSVTMLVMVAYQTRAYAQLLRPTGLGAAGRYLRGLLTSGLNFIVLLLFIALIMIGLLLPTLRQQMRPAQPQAAAQTATTTRPQP